jgi:peptidoglycan/xylan/chitin deacetylase (PgdA/CDA1 family)
MPTVFRILRGELALDGPCFHLSFDDGFENNHRNALPVLEELGISAAFFVSSSFMGARDEVIRENWWSSDPLPIRTLSWDAVRELHAAGHEIGSHTCTHARLSDVSSNPSELSRQVKDSKAEIEDALGVECRYFAWPYGTFRDVDDASLAAIADAGYEGCFSAVRGRVIPGETDPFTVPRHHMEPHWPRLHLRYFASGGSE